MYVHKNSYDVYKCNRCIKLIKAAQKRVQAVQTTSKHKRTVTIRRTWMMICRFVYNLLRICEFS